MKVKIINILQACFLNEYAKETCVRQPFASNVIGKDINCFNLLFNKYTKYLE